jgi:hypothetical protein
VIAVKYYDDTFIEQMHKEIRQMLEKAHADMILARDDKTQSVYYGAY